MNLDPYELDAAARNQDATRQRTAKNREIAKKDLPENLTIASFTAYRQITASRLECLRQAKFDQPVISLYMNLSPDRQIRQKQIYLTLFNSLKHTALHENQSYLDQLAHRQKQAVEHDLLQIHEYLQHRFEPVQARSMALFKSVDQLAWLFTLPLPGHDYLAIDSDPYTMPLVVQSDKQRSVLVLHLELAQATFYRYWSGHISQLDVINSQVPDLSIDLSRPNKVQRHNYEHLNRHFKQACSRLGALSRRPGLSEIILMGDRRALDIFEKDCLTDDKQQQVITTLPYLPGSTEGEIAEQVQVALQDREVAEEGYYLDMIHRENGQNGIVKGLDEVISAQNRHLIRSLLVNMDLKQPGHYCDHDQYISTNEQICPMCERQMLKIDNVVEKLVELASQYQVDYKIIRQQSDQLDKFGGIAATMYDVQ